MYLKERKKINILIVHYNTPEMTECLVRSINKFVGTDCTIYIFDNSDKLPFTYRQDNIVLFDNTNGQIIDFEEWLDGFENKGRDASHRYISARHCISIDKCFDLIDDNFILLDSDVLLRRDISDMWDENFMYIGETSLSKMGVSRLLPFACFINVKKCKKNSIRYFYPDKMRGLSTGDGNKFDTGGGFLFHAKDYEHMDIEISDYIIHYKAGSCPGINVSQNSLIHGNMTPQEWLLRNKGLWKILKHNNKVIYTSITGDYEKLCQPSFVDCDFDYVAFVDDISGINAYDGVWQLRKIPDDLKKLSAVKQQRMIKILPHKYLSEYSESIWVDGSIDILGSMNDFISEYCVKQEKSVFIRKHPYRNSIHEEADKCIQLGKDNREIILKQINKYNDEKFPDDNGLVESGIIYRKHSDPYCKKLMTLWGIEVIGGSHRDQLSFNYVLWKCKDNSGFEYLPSELINSTFFKLYGHGVRKSTSINSRNKKDDFNPFTRQKETPKANIISGDGAKENNKIVHEPKKQAKQQNTRYLKIARR